MPGCCLCGCGTEEEEEEAASEGTTAEEVVGETLAFKNGHV